VFKTPAEFQHDLVFWILGYNRGLGDYGELYILQPFSLISSMTFSKNVPSPYLVL
jgi:hypothetical protein